MSEPALTTDHGPSLPKGVGCPRCEGHRWWWRPGRAGTLYCLACLPPPDGERVNLYET